MKEMEVIISHTVRLWWISPNKIIEKRIKKLQARHRYSVDNEPTATYPSAKAYTARKRLIMQPKKPRDRDKEDHQGQGLY
ncbi:hypothetical protein FOXB_04895 [Fusarium oxysporum f. sp. conglutinans Fo5176]|uniref:Uncharacterized protein n=1 Tax=Fusarium oxysporum (strain Fo5176) TaxID=660025 RepID=F9FER7_FUSOF|nr:hypothetical protein FOXB_04895 [Fusarium oxysporum f. sp. conglutinans Fo5176]